MGLRWMTRRLVAMSPAEVAARTKREAIHRLDDLGYRLNRGAWRRSWNPEEARIGRTEARAAPRGFLTVERARWISDCDPSGVEKILAAAERILEGRYRYFGYPEVVLERPIDYTRDPLTGSRWPNRHGKRIDYRDGTHGDPKWIWELNRLQELPVLVQASLVGDDPRFLDHAVGLASDWISSSEPGRSVVWSNGYEAALRAISLTLLLDGLETAPRLPGGFRESLARCLWQHGRWILRDPSTHSSANNHRVGELAGLVSLGLMLPECPASPTWLTVGLGGLEREAARQIASDGTSVEQAFHYHLHTLDFLLVAVALLDVNGVDPPGAVLDALGRAGDALSAQLGVEEPEPRYGDTDDSWVARLDGGDRRSARSVASAIAARLGHPNARRAAGSLDTAARWLFGEAGATRFADTRPGPEPGSVLLADAGIAILRRDDVRLTFDAGPVGYLSIAAHGHADALSLTLSRGSNEVIVDPGVGSYFRLPGYRTAFRGTPAHATVAIDGLDQSESGGPFLWRRQARSSLLHAGLDAGVLLGEHDGYQSLAAPTQHRRLVVYPEDGPIVVLDRLRTAGVHRICQSWPLHPALDLAEVSSDSALFTRADAPELFMRFAASTVFRIEPFRGTEQPPRGWYSRGLEDVEPAWLLTVDLTADGVVDIVTLLWLTPDKRSVPEAVVEPSRPATSVRFRGSGGGVVLRLDPDNPAAPVERALDERAS